ncbi:MAG: serine protease [Maricaulaceae bacterium]
MRGLANALVLAALIGGGVWGLYAVESEESAIAPPPPAPMPQDDAEIDTIDVGAIGEEEEFAEAPEDQPEDQVDTPDVTEQPEEQPVTEPVETVEREPLPGRSDFDEDVWVGVGQAVAATGTAFSVGDGVWMTARHVVDGCDATVLEVEEGEGPRASEPLGDADGEALSAEISIVTSPLSRAPLALDVAEDDRGLGEDAYLIGYPTGVPGEVSGKLMGRATIQLRGRYAVGEPALVWAETSRTEGIEGHLGGLSGGPAFDHEGEVVGVMVAHAPRRGRIYTSAPSRIAAAVTDTGAETASDAATAGPIRDANYGEVGRRLRRDLRVAKVRCVVE